MASIKKRVSTRAKHLKRKSRRDARSKLFCLFLGNRTTWGFVLSSTLRTIMIKDHEVNLNISDQEKLSISIVYAKEGKTLL